MTSNPNPNHRPWQFIWLSDLHSLLSKSEIALEEIHKGILDYGVLEKFYLFMGKAVLHAMKDGDQGMFQFAMLGTQAILDGSPEIQAQLGTKGLDPKRIEYSYLKIILQQLISLNKEEADKMMRITVKKYIKKSIDPSYTLLSLSGLDNTKQLG
jgi:hypothetical protein